MLPKMLMPKVLRSDYVQIVLIDKDNHEKSGMVPLREGAVTIGRTRYGINEKVATRRGMFRVPTFYYVEGNYGPIDPKGQLKLGIRPRTNSDDEEITEDTVFVDPDGNEIDSIAMPENMRENVTVWLDGDEEYEKMESHVFSDLMRAFSGGLLEDKRLMMLVLIMAAGFIFLWWSMNSEFEDLRLAQSGEPQTQAPRNIEGR